MKRSGHICSEARDCLRFTVSDRARNVSIFFASSYDNLISRVIVFAKCICGVCTIRWIINALGINHIECLQAVEENMVFLPLKVAYIINRDKARQAKEMSVKI